MLVRGVNKRGADGSEPTDKVDIQQATVVTVEGVQRGVDIVVDD